MEGQIGELEAKKEKVEEITSQMIKGSRLVRLIDEIPIPERFDKNKLPNYISNIYNLYKRRSLLGSIDLHDNEVRFSKEKYSILIGELSQRFAIEFKEEWVYGPSATYESINDTLMRQVDIPGVK